MSRKNYRKEIAQTMFDHTVPSSRCPAHIRLLPGDPLFCSQTLYYAHCDPVKRYFWRMVIRGREKEGVKILSCGPILHSLILAEVEKNSARHNIFLHFWELCKKLLAGTFLRSKLENEVPLCLDWHQGFDFLLVKGGNDRIKFFNRSRFLRKKCPAGTIAQIKSWQLTEDVFSCINDQS